MRMCYKSIHLIEPLKCANTSRAQREREHHPHRAERRSSSSPTDWDCNRHEWIDYFSLRFGWLRRMQVIVCVRKCKACVCYARVGWRWWDWIDFAPPRTNDTNNNKTKPIEHTHWRIDDTHIERYRTQNHNQHITTANDSRQLSSTTPKPMTPTKDRTSCYWICAGVEAIHIVVINQQSPLLLPLPHLAHIHIPPTTSHPSLPRSHWASSVPLSIFCNARHSDTNIRRITSWMYGLQPPTFHLASVRKPLAWCVFHSSCSAPKPTVSDYCIPRLNVLYVCVYCSNMFLGMLILSSIKIGLICIIFVTTISQLIEI